MKTLSRLPALYHPLPWPLAVAVLGAIAFPMGWLCAWAGGDAQAMGGNVLLLLVLMASTPFMLRRTRVFTPAIVLLATGVGLAVVLLGAWLGRNPAAVLWLAMVVALVLPAQPTAYGRMRAAQTDLERRSVTPSSSADTPSEQAERMLFVYDFLIVLALAALCVWLKGLLG